LQILTCQVGLFNERLGNTDALGIADFDEMHHERQK